MEILKKDSMIKGVLIGALLPAFVICLLYIGTIYLYNELLAKSLIMTFGLISVAPNVLLMRFLLNKKEQDKTGRGVLLISFVGAFVYFYFFL